MASAPAKYRRIVELGRGGMAVVHLAAMRSSHDVTKLVVVKELQANLAADPDFRTMFLDEARLAARLNHPNVVQTFEIIDHVALSSTASDGLDGVCALVMEYLEGQPLNRVRARLKADSEAVAIYLAMLVDALTGLEYAHTLNDYDGRPLGIVHRDVSPHNVFVTYSGEVKVLDFGIAKANDGASAPTQVGTVKGKVAYMSPEHARGDRVDARSDVFACGVMLWEVAVGRRLWAGHNEAAILYKLQGADIPKPRDIKPDVPEALDAICQRALAHDPAARYQSAAELRDAIEAYAATLPTRPTRRMLGERMCKLFETERQQVRLVVEQQLGRVTAASTDQFESIAIPSGVKIPSPKDSSSSSVTTNGPPTGPTRVTSAASVSPGDVRARTGMIIGIAAVALLTASLALAFVIRARGEAPATTTTAAPTQITQPTAAATNTAAARRMLVIDPPSAVVTVDGKRLPPGAASIDGPNPVALHAEAAGFAPLDAHVSFDTSDPFVVRLAAVAAPTSTKHVIATPTRTATTHTTPTGRPTTSPTDVGY